MRETISCRSNHVHAAAAALLSRVALRCEGFGIQWTPPVRNGTFPFGSFAKL